MWNDLSDDALGLQLVNGPQHRIITVNVSVFHHEKHFLTLTSFCVRPLRSTTSQLVGIYQEFSFEMNIFLGNEKIA